MPKTIIEQISTISSDVSNIKYFFGVFVGSTVTIAIAVFGFFANWIYKNREEQDKRIDEIFEFIRGDIEKINDTFEHEKSELFSKANSALQITSGHNKEIESMGKVIERIQDDCREKHKNKKND
jgi:ferritin